MLALPLPDTSSIVPIPACFCVHVQSLTPPTVDGASTPILLSATKMGDLETKTEINFENHHPVGLTHALLNLATEPEFESAVLPSPFSSELISRRMKVIQYYIADLYLNRDSMRRRPKSTAHSEASLDNR
jgi:hypothetical protein